MKYQNTKAVVIGRFSSAFHLGHVHLFNEALKVANQVRVVIGSSECYPNTKNPLTVRQRIAMITDWMRESLSEEDIHRIKFSFVPDFRYNDEKWKTEVREAVDETRDDKIVMVAFDKDEDSYWIREFGWNHHQVQPVMCHRYGKHVPVSATFVRDDFLRSGRFETSYLPFSTTRYLQKFAMTPEYTRLREERLMWDREKAKFKDYPYADALNCCTADVVVICNNHVLLIERKFAPGKGAWALPGGHKQSNETFKQCAIRELSEEVKMKVPVKAIVGSIEEERMFDHPQRSAEFCKPTMAYYIVIEPNHDGSLPKIKAQDDAKKAFWVPMHEFKKNRARLFDDHAEIITFMTGI